MSFNEELLLMLQTTDPGSVDTDYDRRKIKDALYEAYRRMQSPWEMTLEFAFASAGLGACIEILMNLGLFHKWVVSGCGTKSVDDFARDTGADEALLRRVLRVLGSHHLIVPTAEDTYHITPWVQAFEDPEVVATYRGWKHITGRLLANLPAYLKATNYRNPVSSTDNNFHHLYGRQYPDAFAYCAQDPKLLKDVAGAFALHARQQTTPWTNIYPTYEIVQEAHEKPDRPIIVDVGGGIGFDLQSFAKANPGLPAESLILQDLPSVLDSVQLPRTIKKMPHDYFSIQPIRGAKIYFMHSILNAYDDDACGRILSSITPAMDPGYSRMLIQESIITHFNPPMCQTTTDILWAACMGSYERSESDWNCILNKAGLRVTKAHRPVDSDSPEVIIEAEYHQGTFPLSNLRRHNHAHASNSALSSSASSQSSNKPRRLARIWKWNVFRPSRKPQ